MALAMHCVSARSHSITQDHVEVMRVPSPPENKIGLLECVCFAMLLLLGSGSAFGVWTFNLLIPLLLLAVVYGVVCDVRALARLKTSDGAARSMPPRRPTEDKRCGRPPTSEN